MPNDLAALLAQDGAIDADVLERAVARQREVGGTLDTALLEAGAIGEERLVEYLSRAAELPPAPPSAWSGDDARARRVFPSRVAERHGLAPFALEDRELSLVATHPVDLGLLDEISFMLSLHLTAHVGPEWRVRELIHRLYGTPLPPRLAALAAAAGAAPPPPAAAPGQGGEPSPPQPAAPRAGFGRDESEPLEPLAAALAQALEAVELPEGDGAATDDELPDGPEQPQDEPELPAAAPDRTAPPRWTLEEARAALAGARDRDAVVLQALRFARDFFEFAAMFAVTRDAVAGHDALGPEDARERCRGVAIWASDPGTFKTVIEMRSPHLGPIARDAAGNEAILRGLGREVPHTALVYPVLLRDRPVCVLYADNGEAPISPRRLGDLLLLLATVGGAFERIIRDRKIRRRGPAAAGASPPPAPEPSPPEPGPPASAALEPAALEPPAPSAGPPEPERRARPEAPPAGDDAVRGDSAPAGPQAPAAADSLDGLDDQLFAITLDVSDLDEPAEPAAAGDAKTLLLPAVPAAQDAPPVAAAPPAGAAEQPAALADRALDPDAASAAAACAALAARRRDPAIRPAVEKLRRALLSGIAARAVRAARALGAMRDVESIPLLIQVLETSEPEVGRAAADALAEITLQRLGPDARKWLGWWKQNRGRGRAEWLFSGLTSPDRQTRVAASVELSLSAPPPVAYSADMPAADRENAARAWAGWWSRSGHVL